MQHNQGYQKKSGVLEDLRRRLTVGLMSLSQTYLSVSNNTISYPSQDFF